MRALGTEQHSAHGSNILGMYASLYAPVCVGDMCVVDGDLMKLIICSHWLQVSFKSCRCQGNCYWEVESIWHREGWARRLCGRGRC
jgi:hypothetical protein